MKVGIITNTYEVPRIQTLIRYLEDKAEVQLYVEEDVLVNFHNVSFDENVFFTKGKGYILLTLARMAEAYGKDSGIPVVNDARSTWIATHRFISSTICYQAGVPVPEFSFGPSTAVAFEKFIAKNIIDQNHLRFLDALPVVGEPGIHISPVKTGEEAGDDERIQHHYYYQRFLRSEFEYKIYGFGETLLYYRQLPVLVNPDKMATRVPIDENPELKRMALLAMKATGLKIASMDFLNEDGKFYLTDINPIPNFNYITDGEKMVGDYLLELAR